MSLVTKLLLEWNFRFGHNNRLDTQIILWSPTFGMDKFISSICITFEQCFKYEVCQYKKLNCRAIHGNKIQIDVACEGSLRDSRLRPGSCVAVDHFEPLLKGCTYTYFGSIHSEKFVGLCIFIDNMSRYIQVEHQI